jgi:hypothetical protein
LGCASNSARVARSILPRPRLMFSRWRNDVSQSCACAVTAEGMPSVRRPV